MNTTTLARRWYPYWCKAQKSKVRAYRRVNYIRTYRAPRPEVAPLPRLVGAIPKTHAFCKHIGEWNRRMQRIKRAFPAGMDFMEIDDAMRALPPLTLR